MTSQRSTFADVDDEIFAADDVPTTTRDVRSVGELLFNVDHLARQLLMDVTGEDAEPLLRSWPGLAKAAADVWSSLPRRPWETRSLERTAASLSAHTETLQASLDKAGTWPGNGATHPSLDQMADDLLRACHLITRYGAQVRPEQTGPAGDLAAARTRVMHGLYLTAHAVSVALHESGRDRVRELRSAGRRVPPAQHHAPYVIAPLGRWVDRIAACENDARSYLLEHPVQTLSGEASRHGDGPRLTQALALWDIACHRTLAHAPEAPDLVLITRTEGLIAAAGAVLVEASRPLGDRCDTERLPLAIASAGRSWRNLANRWGDLAPAGSPVAAPLVRAAAEVRAAYRQITHVADTLASLEAIAARPEFRASLRAALRGIQAGMDIAQTVADMADNTGLRGPARALSRRAHNDVEAGLTSASITDDIVWVSPEAILARSVVPLPEPVAEALRDASAAAVDAASSAARAVGTELAAANMQPVAPQAVPFGFVQSCSDSVAISRHVEVSRYGSGRSTPGRATVGR